MKLILWLMVFAMAAMPQSPGNELSGLLARLSKDPGDTGVLSKLEGEPRDPQIHEALVAAFDHAADKKSKQQVAKTLIVIGDKSEQYFQYLAGFARTAVESDAPDPFYYDPAGHAVRGMMSPQLESWALTRGLDPRSVMAQVGYLMPEDVHILAQARDVRANSLFREGLKSNLPLVVAYSAEGLALLRDTSAIPPIAEACDRLNSGPRAGIAWQFAKFGDLPDAERALQHYVPDAKLRATLQHEAAQYWQLEMQKQAHESSKPVK